MSRQPKPGEWWFSPDGEDRAFCCGVDGDGETLFEVEWNEFGKSIPDNYIHVPDCDSWDWKLPAIPDGYELCGPPADAGETIGCRVLFNCCWYLITVNDIGKDGVTYCRPAKNVFNLGPQKEPSSVARIAAQLRQVAKELEGLEVSDVGYDAEGDS